MPTYVTLSNFTDQGIRSIKDTVKRAEAFRKAAKESGVTIKDILWTQGQYDLITIMEVSDEAAATALALNVAKMGNIRGQTLRAFTAAEMEKTLEPIQEEWIHAEWFVRVKRRSMMRIMARRKKAATVLV